MEPDDAALREAALYEAAAWRIQLTEHRLETTPAFEAWLAVERHAEAWEQTEVLWGALATLGTHPRIGEHRKGALARTRRRRVLVSMAGGLAATLCLIIGGAAYERLGAGRLVATPKAERRVMVLEDGTRLVLDAGTRLRVRLGRSAREVDLLTGQARFDVAHDPDRPFRVHADGRVVTALGTSFTVDRTSSALTVTLIKGRVSVVEDPPVWRLSPAASPATVLLAGQRVSIAAATKAAGPVEPVSLEQATAWEGGRLEFDNEPLAGAVERVGRYSAAGLRIGDERAGRLRVSGVFDAGDTRAFVAAVTQYFGLEAVVAEDGAVVLQIPANK